MPGTPPGEVGQGRCSSPPSSIHGPWCPLNCCVVVYPTTHKHRLAQRSVDRSLRDPVRGDFDGVLMWVQVTGQCPGLSPLPGETSAFCVVIWPMWLTQPAGGSRWTPRESSIACSPCFAGWLRVPRPRCFSRESGGLFWLDNRTMALPKVGSSNATRGKGYNSRRAASGGALQTSTKDRVNNSVWRAVRPFHLYPTGRSVAGGCQAG